MKNSVLRGNGLVGNIIFDRDSSANRDDCFAPYVLLKSRLKELLIQIDTPDVALSKKWDFEIHQDVQQPIKNNINYLLMFETELVKPENYDTKLLAKYRKIFTWNDELVDGDRFIKINFPNPIAVHSADGFSSRNRFCCLIASNRSLDVHDDRILYPERIKAIRWFETYAPEDFDLYGLGWNLPVVGGGVIGRIERRFWSLLDRFFKLTPFPSYRGKVMHKSEVLKQTRFAICYENVRDLPGYITEKIFDCFFSGCVPIYWGASNISDYIPSDCFIDRRQFDDIDSVYRFMKSMNEVEFKGYQQRIANFLQSDNAYPFSSEFFAETVVNTIVNDIDC